MHCSSPAGPDNASYCDKRADKEHVARLYLATLPPCFAAAAVALMVPAKVLAAKRQPASDLMETVDVNITVLNPSTLGSTVLL